MRLVGEASEFARKPASGCPVLERFDIGDLDDSTIDGMDLAAQPALEVLG
jgi:hypothetical protein